MKNRTRAALLAAPFLLLAPAVAVAAYPEKPIRVIIPLSVPARNVKELIAIAKKHPGQLNYASAGVGSNIFMSTELFSYLAKIKMTQIPFKGGGPATIGLISGEADVIITALTSAVPNIKQGRMRGLAVTTKERSFVLPDLPTVIEAGVPGYDKAGWYGMYAPAKVPKDIINKIYTAVAKVLKDPVIAKRLKDQGSVAVGNPPDEFTTFVHTELKEWAELIKKMNIKL